MKNLIATALVSFSWVLLVSGGPIETSSTKTSTTKSTVSSIKSIHRTGSSSHTTTSTSSSRNSTTSTGNSTTTSHHTTSSTWSPSSGFSSHISSHISSYVSRTNNSTKHITTSSSQSRSTPSHYQSGISSGSLGSSGHIFNSANATGKYTTSTSQSSFTSNYNTSSTSYGTSGRISNSANATASSTTISGKPTSSANSTSTQISSTAKAAQGKSSTVPDVKSKTSSALYSLHSFTGPEDGTTPPWNLNNVSCYEMTFLNATQQWAAVNGDSVIETFNEMYAGNKLMCSECFGQTKGACTSTDLTCGRGLSDLAALANGTDHSRWDTAAAIFAQDPDDTDMMCDIGTSECTSSPKCELLDGPGAWAILKSIETMYNMLENVYASIQAAGDAAGHQMQAFSNTFAPVPSFKNDAIWLMVMIAIIGAILGLVTGGAGLAFAASAEAAAATAISVTTLVVGTAIGGVTGVASAVGVNEFFFGMPAPGDTDSPLGTIISATLLTWSNFCDNLMATGSYTFASDDGKSSTTITMQNLMKDGALMQANANTSQGFVAMQPVMELIMFQQLALYTWQNLQSSDVSLTPYIVYDNEPCDKLNVTYQMDYYSGEDVPVFGADSILSYLPGIYTLDANITYDGKCYWLLGAKPDGDRVFGKKVAPSFHCEGERTLPGATNDDLKKNAGIFAGLSLKDWIIPSVLGWKENFGQNGYKMASSQGQLVSDPLQPATVNVPVCEYIRNKESPGVGCPKLKEHQTGACDTYSPSTGVNQPGAFHPGRCNAHIDQYQRNEPQTVNPLPVFQMSVVITDANGIEIGQATKQSAAHALEVVDSALPYDLIVIPGDGDQDPDKFWYADQYWNTTSSMCSVGAYDSGMRQLDCGFECDFPSGSPPASATIAHPIPGGATAAIGGDKTFVNTYATANPTPAPSASGPPPPPPPPTYATGSCGVHIKQYQKNEGDENPTSNYLLDVTLFDGKQKPIGQMSQVSALKGVPVSIPGLNSPFTVTADATDDAPLVCEFQGRKFTMDPATCGKHAIGAYDSGNRNMDCGFPC